MIGGHPDNVFIILHNRVNEVVVYANALCILVDGQQKILRRPEIKNTSRIALRKNPKIIVLIGKQPVVDGWRWCVSL